MASKPHLQIVPSPAEARAIAKDAYIYGYAMVQAYLTMYAFSIDKHNPQYQGPFNAPLSFARVFTPDDSAFVTPNSDTPYTFLSLDLGAEPMVLTVPAVEKNRYWVFPMMDLYRFNFDYLGTRTTGNGGGTFLVAGPRWKGTVPSGISKVLRPETEFINVVGRTQLFQSADLDHVKKIQSGYKAQPLSEFLGRPAPPVPPAVPWIINSPMMPNLKLDSEGGLTIYIQSDSPGNDKESNWLPCPKAFFMLVMRYYLPKPELIQGTWKSPSAVRTN